MSHFDGEDPFAEMRSPITPLIGPAEAAAQRGRVVARMQRLQESSQKRRGAARAARRHLRGVFAAVAVAAAMACAAVFYRGGAAAPVAGVAPFVEANSSNAAILRGDRTVMADRGPSLSLQVSDRVQTTRDGGATLRLRSGATIALSSSTDLGLVRDEPNLEEVSLREGRVNVRVPKLAKGDLLIVRTPDSSVTVRGTLFSVTFGQLCKDRRCTQVSIEEGRVEVEHAGVTLLLEGGDRWSSGGDSVSPEPVASERPTVASASAPSHAEIPPASATRPAVARSTLAEENALIERAMSASRAGNAAHAVSLLEEHLEKYPRSPLARNAELERVRALDRSGNLASARAAARRYLARYPDGMGSDEARRIAVGTRSPESKPPAP